MATRVRSHQLGGPEVLKIEEVPVQEPTRGEVRLRVQAMGLNRSESITRIGLSRHHCSGGWSPRICAPTSLSLTQITRPGFR